MKNFNENFQLIGGETKKLQEAHLAAKALSRKQVQAMNGVKEYIAELTMSRDVSTPSLACRCIQLYYPAVV